MHTLAINRSVYELQFRAMNEHELTVEESIMECPTCNSKHTTKNGSIHNGKQKYVCKDCGRQFIENLQNKRTPQQLWDRVDKLLLEKIPIAGISRVTEISEPWLQQYINQKHKHVPQQIDISKKRGT